MSFNFMLYAAQAAGYGVNLWAEKKASKFEKMGTKLEQQELSLQLQQEQLASTEEAISNTERLRETMAYQRAVSASRGVQVGQGSAHFVGQKSIGKYNMDERARQLSMSFRKHQIESQQRLLGIRQAASKSERKANSFVQGINMLNVNTTFGDMLNKPSRKLNG